MIVAEIVGWMLVASAIFGLCRYARYIASRTFLKRESNNKTEGRLLFVIVFSLLGAIYSCTPQSGGVTIPGTGGCDTVYIESPVLGEFQRELQRLRQEAGVKDAEIATLNQKLTNRDNTIAEKENVILSLNTANNKLSDDLKATQDNLNTLQADHDALHQTSQEQFAQIQKLEVDLQACLDNPEVIRDTIYQDKIVEVIPPPAIDTLLITHCADSTKNTTWYHWGGLTPYPHVVSMASKELGMVDIIFKDSLTDEIKAQKSYQLKRTKDYENAKTTYEFIK